MHEHIQESLLQERKTRRNLDWYFHSFLQVFERDFMQQIIISTGRNDGLKPSNVLNLIQHIGNKTRQFSVLLL